MWSEQDDFDEETDILIMTALEEREEQKRKNAKGKNVPSGQESGGCLIFVLALVGLAALPWILLVGNFGG